MLAATELTREFVRSVESWPTVDTKSDTEQIVELLELGRCMGPGERYLMLYEGVLAITNRTGLAWWPRGNKRKIAVFDAADCVFGLSSLQWDEILGRLQRIRSAEQAPQAHPT